MAHFKNRRENMSQVIYYNNRQCKLYDTLIYNWYIWWPKFVINTLIFENTIIKHYINIVSSGYLYQLQSSSLILQYSSWGNRTDYCLQSMLQAMSSPRLKTRQYNNPRGKKHHQHFSVSRSCPNSSRYKIPHLQPSTNEHPTLQLFALAIINSDTNFTDI